MKEMFKNSIIFFVMLLVILFNQNILILLGNLNKLFLVDNDLRGVEIKLLKEENKSLKGNINELKKVFKLKEYSGYNYEISNVIIRNIYQINESLVIEKGQDYGIKKGMAVVNEDGLVGIVNSVNKKTSEVKLITSSENEVSIKVGDAFGVLSGYENGYLIGNKISNYDDFNVGDEVYTSGLGNLPSNLLIGNVKEIKPGDYNIEQEIYVEPKIQLENLKYLIIIKSIKEV